MKGKEMKKRDEKLRKALANLRTGKDADGNPINLAEIAAITHRETMEYAKKVHDGECRTRAKTRHMRFKG